VVRLSNSAFAFQADEPRRFARFAALHTQLHPEVRRDLAAAAFLPQTLEITGQSVLKTRHETVVISNVRRVTFDYPLPAGLVSDLIATGSGDDRVKQTGIQAALNAIKGQASTPKPSLQALNAAAKRADAAGRPLDVLLLFFEITQEYGPTLMASPEGVKTLQSELAPLVRKAALDPETARFLAASNLSSGAATPGDRQATASFLASVKMDDRPYGTFRLVTFANLVRGSGDVSKWDSSIFKSMPSPLANNYWVHIAAHPWSSLTYKDAGDAYLQAFDPSDAWLAYDLGREIDKDWRLGTMKALSTFEDQLRTAQPDFF
jgi:hypothetical protein